MCYFFIAQRKKYVEEIGKKIYADKVYANRFFTNYGFARAELYKAGIEISITTHKQMIAAYNSLMMLVSELFKGGRVGLILRK